MTHPEDVPWPPPPRSLLAIAWAELGRDEVERITTRLPLADATVRVLGSDEGLDSVRWSIEHDDALATLAARRLAALDPALASALAELDRCGRDVEAVRRIPAEGLAADLVAVRRQALDGLLAYYVHRRERPVADSLTRLVRAALGRGVLTREELVEEAVARIAKPVLGGCANVTGAARIPTDVAGDELYRVRPDAAILVDRQDAARRDEVFALVEEAFVSASGDPAKVLREVLSELDELGVARRPSILWLCGPRGFLAARGRVLVRARASGVRSEWESVDDSLRTFDVEEGDTFVLCATEEHAAAVVEAASRPTPPPVNVPLRQALATAWSRRFAIDLSVRSLIASPLDKLALAILEASSKEPNACVALIRVPVWSPPPDFEARLAALAKLERLEVRRATLRSGELHATFGADPMLGERRARASAEAFVESLRARHPRLCRSAYVTVEPLVVGAAPDLDAIRSIAYEVARARVGIKIRVDSVPRWGGLPRARVLVVRADEDGAEDETAAAREVRRRLASAGLEADVRAEYIK